MKEILIIPAFAMTLLLTGCGDHGHPHDTEGAHDHSHDEVETAETAEAHGHPHATADTAAEAHGHPHETAEAHGHPHGAMEDYGHDEKIALGTFKAGALNIEASQGHGAVKAGKEGHLTLKLPYSDGGATVVRAWIGTEDRTLSAVGKGSYTASNDVYDIHAVAPSPLPANVKWWVSIEKPDGTEIIGSIEPKM
jgi:hypothetical protein